MQETAWSRRIADELWSGPVTPLTYSLLAEPMAEHLVRRRLRHAGLSEAADRAVFRLVRGHVYVNASLVAEVMRELPRLFVSKGLLELLPENLRKEVRESERSLLGTQTIHTVLQLTWNERAWMPWSRAGLFRQEAARVREVLGAFALVAQRSNPELLVAFSQIQQRLGSYLEVVSWGMIYAFVFFHLTTQLLERWAPGEESSIAQLTSGLAGIQTFEVHDELVACAGIVRQDPSLCRAVLEENGVELLARCQQDQMGHFGRRLRSFLERHGHRLVGRDLSYPTWRESPEIVLEILRKLVHTGPLPSAEERRRKRELILRRILTRISAGAGGLFRRKLFLRGLSWCQEYYALRENMRYHADTFLAVLRSLALEAGGRLQAQGALGDARDVFYLTKTELQASLADPPGGNGRFEIREAAATRRAQYETFRGSPPAAILWGDEGATACTRASWGEGVRSAALLRGLGVSPGRVEGAARVVRSVRELESLREGEVIVAPTTDPSWTSLLALGGALVLEVGGFLSHGAIVARELGIPAVVDVAAATSLLRTGEMLAVDGSAGTVGRCG